MTWVIKMVKLLFYPSLNRPFYVVLPHRSWVVSVFQPVVRHRPCRRHRLAVGQLATIPDKHLRSPSSCSSGISPLSSCLDDGCRTCTATNPITGTSSDRNHRRDRRRHCVEIFLPQLFGTNSCRPATQSPLPSPMSPPPT